MLSGMTLLVDRSVTRVQAWLAKQDHKNRREIADQADLDEKTLRLAIEADWDPRASTLRKLEQLMPRRRKAAQQDAAA
jgi:hypothetical protein